jgi:hypothetical protein
MRRDSLKKVTTSDVHSLVMFDSMPGQRFHRGKVIEGIRNGDRISGFKIGFT